MKRQFVSYYIAARVIRRLLLLRFRASGIHRARNRNIPSRFGGTWFTQLRQKFRFRPFYFIDRFITAA